MTHVDPPWLQAKLDRVRDVRAREAELRQALVQPSTPLDRWCASRVDLLPLREDYDAAPRYRVHLRCVQTSTKLDTSFEKGVGLRYHYVTVHRQLSQLFDVGGGYLASSLYDRVLLAATDVGLVLG